MQKMIICKQGIQRKRRTEQLGLGNGRVMELKLVKHDDALQELKEFWSAWTIEQPANTTPLMEQGIMMRLNDRESKKILQAITRVILQGYRQVVNATNKIGVNNAEWSFAGKACKEKEGPNNWVTEMAKSWSKN